MAQRVRSTGGWSGSGIAIDLLCAASALAAAGADRAGATVCPNPPLPAVAGVCALTPGDAGLLLRGTLLVPGDVLENGQLLLDGSGLIVCAACDCSAEPGFDTATRIDCPDGAISPGLINAVDYLNYAQNPPALWGEERYEHRHEWRLGLNGHTQIDVAGGASANAQRWGELRGIMGGTTSVCGNVGQAKLARNLDTTQLQTEGLTSPFWVNDSFPFDDTTGALLDGSCAYPALPSAPVGAPYWLTLAEGVAATARNEFVCASDDSGAAGGADVIAGALVNRGIALTAADVAEMAAAGATLIWSPRSNLALYGRTSPITGLHRRGVPIALGTDWIVTGSISMTRELACADEYNRRYAAGRLSDRELFEAATANAAAAAGMDDEIGRLAVGRQGDVAVFRRAGRSAYRAVIEGSPRRLALVLRGGRPLLGEDAVLAAWPGDPCSGDTVINDCGLAVRACLLGEIGASYATLAGGLAGIYPAFFCDTPDDEPTCRPQRTAVTGGFPTHDGIPNAADLDGDGYANAADKCPHLFDPPVVSPLAQPDADGDGVGDACDFCPTSASATGCGELSATDLVADLTLPGTVRRTAPFAATLVVTNVGAGAAAGRAVLPTLREMNEVTWTCVASGGGACPAAGSGGLDEGVTLPPGAGATFTIRARYPGPPTAPGAHLVAVAAAIPDATVGEEAPLDNYDATTTVIEDAVFCDDFESGSPAAWSALFML